MMIVYQLPNRGATMGGVAGNRPNTFAMLCRVKSCIKKLSNMTNVGCHDGNMLKSRGCSETKVEARRKKERIEEAVVMWKD